LNEPAVQRTKGLSYSRLCDLAEMTTFLDSGAQAPAGARQRDAEQLFRETLADERVRSEVARIAPIWASSPHRRHGGVFFAGNIVGQFPRGQVTECNVDLGGGQTFVILVPPSLAGGLRGSGPLIVVGSIVAQPADKVTGYTGSVPQAVWVSSLLGIE
jgi:hypothetical protein